MPRASTAAHDRVIAFANPPEAGPAPIIWDLVLDDHPALLTNRVSAVAGMAALLNLAHAYKAAVVGTTRPDTTPPTATRSRRAGRDRCFDTDHAADRPDLSAVRSSLLPETPAPEILMTMQGDHAS
jgi:hypothetical protein